MNHTLRNALLIALATSLASSATVYAAAGGKSASAFVTVNGQSVAKSRADMTIAAKALDRVLRAGHYWVPHWFSGKHRVASWNRLSRPAIKPRYDRGIIDTWWLDAAKAAKLPPSN